MVINRLLITKHTDTHRHTQTQTDMHRHTHTHTDTHMTQTGTHRHRQGHTDTECTDTDRHTQTQCTHAQTHDTCTQTWHTQTDTHRHRHNTDTHRHTHTHAPVAPQAAQVFLSIVLVAVARGRNPCDGVYHCRWGAMVRPVRSWQSPIQVRVRWGANGLHTSLVSGRYSSTTRRRRWWSLGWLSVHEWMQGMLWL